VIEERRLGREVLQQLERSPLVREDFTMATANFSRSRDSISPVILPK
jgi:hypothetical protein